MRRLSLLLPLAGLLGALAAGCGGGRQSASRSFDGLDAVRRLHVTVPAGRVEVRTGARGTFAVDVSCEGTEPKLEALVTRAKGDTFLVRDESGQPGWKLDVRVTAPAGVEVEIATAGADVAVEGDLAALEVGTVEGSVRVDAAVAGGASVRTASGDVRYVARAAPREDLSCTSTSGDVAVHVPASFRGSVHVGGAAGGVRVPQHPRHTRMVWEPDERNVKGWVGEAPTDGEMNDPSWKEPPGIWARTTTGEAEFALLDG